MTYEEKRKELDNYNPLDYYADGLYVDASDTAQNWLMAKITAVIGNEVQVTYDGWPSRWDAVSYSRLLDPVGVGCLAGGGTGLIVPFHATPAMMPACISYTPLTKLFVVAQEARTVDSPIQAPAGGLHRVEQTGFARGAPARIEVQRTKNGK